MRNGQKKLMNTYKLMKPIKYHCVDCVACLNNDDLESSACECKFDGYILDFDVKIKSPCHRFIPAEYITALNFDVR